MTADAYEAWAEVEADSGTALVTPTGGVDLFPSGAAIDPEPYRTSLDEVGVPHEWIDGAEVRRRWPAFGRGTAVTDDVMAIYSPSTGIVAADLATASLQRLAAEHGAELRPNTPVRQLRPVGGEVDVVTDSGAVRCGTVVVCADAWTNRLLEPLGHGIELAVTREQVTYFATADLADLRPGRFPVWIWMDDPSFYGFPEFGVAGAFKVAEDCGGPVVDAETRTFDPDPAMENRLRQFVGTLVGERRASTAHDDVSVHAHVRSRLRGRSAAGRAADLRRSRSRPRVQVRRLVRSPARRPGDRRHSRSRAGAVLDHP